MNIFIDPKYLSQIKLDLHKIFRVTSCGCPKIIKIINKQINKQTNIFLYPKYLSQIKLDLHKIVRLTFFGSPQMIKKTTKNKQTIKQINIIRS